MLLFELYMVLFRLTLAILHDPKDEKCFLQA